MDGIALSHVEDVTYEVMLGGYAQGIFPMAEARDSQELIWMRPAARGIIPLEPTKTGRSLRKIARKCGYQLSIDHDFEAIIALCAAPALNREESWINLALEQLYLDLFKRGHAHSVEIWQDQILVGGLFGVTLGGAFFGESMVSRADNASKIALGFLIDRLHQHHFKLLDTQYITPHLRTCGGVEIKRHDYEQQLKQALKTVPQANCFKMALTAVSDLTCWD
ncbi:MAG: leucyl/phenylalanyl-tRNA--protein transferase [Alphaproteobacteria bacterium]